MQVSSIVTPLIGNSYSCCEDLNKEITLVANAICSCAERLLPLCKGPAKKKHWYKDQTLSQLAIKKREAWDKWSSNGRPKEGFLYDAKIRTRAEFRKRLRVCAANSERKRIQHFDHQFKQRSSNQFKLPLRRKQQGTALHLNGEVVTDQHTLLKAWEEHFQEISSKHSEQTSEMTCSDEEIEHLLHLSFLDVTFDVEEVDAVLRKLKCGKTAGHDGVQAEHLKYGGPILSKWLLQVCNAVTVLEQVPHTLKLGIITPVYKGGGKDPLDRNSYRGITLTSVFAKVLESLLLTRLQCHLTSRGVPHTNQTAYRRGISCAEAIFSTMEVISMYSEHYEKMYMCFYDLQKAFDTVQYSILLKRLYEVGVHGRAWRLLKSWYSFPKSLVKICNSFSSPITLERGVLQGSVLSPILFLLVMDPLLHYLQGRGLGPSVGTTYAGTFVHADDIHTVSSSITTLQEQIESVHRFAVENSLSLNPTKCEVLLISSTKPAITHLQPF